MAIIETHQLTFGFTKNDQILHDLNLVVEKGAIIKLFGSTFRDNRAKILANTGCLIEQPSLYEHLSGIDNLEITRRIRNVSKSQIDKVLILVYLKAAARKKVKEYSLGMNRFLYPRCRL